MNKECKKCGVSSSENNKFCPTCGQKFPEYTIKSIPKVYREPYGVWHVTTDNEGVLKDLGIHRGFIDIIAQELGARLHCSLCFTHVKQEKKLLRVPEHGEATISFGVDSNTSEMTRSERAEVFATIFKKRNILVAEASAYASINLVW